MKKIVYVALSLLLLACSKNDPKIPQIPIETMDEQFKAYLVENFDLNYDGLISEEEATLVKELDCSNKGISSLQGIQYFPNLEMLNCSNNSLYAIDISQNTALKSLFCDFCDIRALDVSKNLALETLSCRSNFSSYYQGLDTLYINPELKFLDINGHRMQSLDFSGNKHLKELYCQGTNLINLNVRQSILEAIDCMSDAQLDFLDIDECTALKEITCRGRNLSFVSSNCPSLENVYASGLRNLDVSDSPLLKILECSFAAGINQLDFSNNPALEDFKIEGGNFILIDLSNSFQLVNVEMFNCSFEGNRSLDLSNRKSLISFSYSWLRMGGTELESINFNGCASLENVTISHSTYGRIQSLNFSGCTSLRTLNCSGGGLTELNLNGCLNLSSLNCSQNALNELNLDGCSDLLTLNCVNNKLTKLDIRECTKLTELACSYNKLTSLEINSDNLSIIHCGWNEITALKIHSGIRLKEMYCDYNQIISLNLTDCMSLEILDCSGNNLLMSLTVNDCTSLVNLNCLFCSLTTLDVSNCSKLIHLDCTSNRLQPILDVRQCTSLRELICWSNPDLAELIIDRNNVLQILNKDPHTEIVWAD